MTNGHMMNSGHKRAALRRQKEREARRESILRAAKKVFFSKGFSDASVDEIAMRSGLAKGTIYLYFRSKEEIYVSLLAKGFSILRKELDKVAALPLPADQLLVKMVEGYLGFYMRHSEYFRIMFMSAQPDVRGKVPPESLEASLEEGIKCLHTVEAVIGKGIAEGTFRAVDPWVAANVIWAMSNGLIVNFAQDPVYRDEIAGATLEEFLKHALDMALKGLEKR